MRDRKSLGVFRPAFSALRKFTCERTHHVRAHDEMYGHMTSAIAVAFAAALGLASAVPASAAKPTDPQIAHIAYTAGQLDIAAGKQALDKSKNEEVRAFAQRMISDHTSVNDQALALVKKLNVTPEDNPTSKSLTEAADAERNKLASLDGAAFDRAYIDNEVAYHKTVNDALQEDPHS
jgi:putative membrane protein